MHGPDSQGVEGIGWGVQKIDPATGVFVATADALSRDGGGHSGDDGVGARLHFAGMLRELYAEWVQRHERLNVRDW